MSDENKIGHEMSDDAVRAAWSSSTCCACNGAAKSKVAAFCLSCTLALSLYPRNVLAIGPEDPRYVETWRSSLRHLRMHADRIKRIGGWNLRTKDEILDAGYKQIGSISRCKASGCGESIAWFEDDLGNKIPVNISDCQPHRTSCANPEFFRQRRLESRKVRTSAQRRRGGRR